MDLSEVLYSVEDLLEKADARLLKRMQNHAQYLHSILPNNNKSHHVPLRKRGHIFS